VRRPLSILAVALMTGLALTLGGCTEDSRRSASVGSSVTPGGLCGKEGATAVVGNVKVKCTAEGGGKKRWKIVEYIVRPTEQPGALPNGRWVCTFRSGDIPFERTLTVDGNAYTIRGLGDPKRPSGLYASGSGPTPHNGVSLSFSSGPFTRWSGELVAEEPGVGPSSLRLAAPGFELPAEPTCLLRS
jgi:hypothetical protein